MNSLCQKQQPPPGMFVTWLFSLTGCKTFCTAFITCLLTLQILSEQKQMLTIAETKCNRLIMDNRVRL